MVDSNETNNENKLKSYKAALLFLMLLLAGSVAYNVYQYKSEKQVVITHATEVDSLINARIAVERELVSIEMELEKFRGIAANLDSLLLDANDKIAQQEKRIRQLIANEKNYVTLNNNLKKELESLRKLRDEYLEKVDNLIAENNKLKSENEKLTGVVNNLNEQKNQLQNKVTIASQLSVEYVKVNAYKKRNSGKLVESVIAKRTNKIEACFTILENKIAEQGEKLVYLKISAPNGKTLAGISKSSFTDVDGNEIDATAVQRIIYNGDKQNLCLSYDNDERILESGTYSIQLYIEGRLVHQSNYVLR
ncbi:MAG: hypothetical protein ACK4K9_01160 [Bacteroidia bacterium]